jgi:hypothetical protein
MSWQIIVFVIRVVVSDPQSGFFVLPPDGIVTKATWPFDNDFGHIFSHKLRFLFFVRKRA